jgi:WhiB family redox-sensing transcriptional regulator
MTEPRLIGKHVPGRSPVLLQLLVEIDDENLEWQEEALCREVDGDMFFPLKGGSTRAAKAVCRRCPVTLSCLEWALDTNERHGIYGGYSERERRTLANQRRRNLGEAA